MNALLIAFVLPILYVIEPFWRIRITHFATDRMGHLSGDPYVFQSRRILDPDPPRMSRFLIVGRPCNRALLTIWKRHLPIRESRFLSAFWHYSKTILKKTRFNVAGEQVNDDHLEFSLDAPRLSFSDDEDRRGRELLAQLGIGPDDWFVALHVRDIAYTRLLAPQMTEQELRDPLTKNFIRYGNILDYLAAAHHVTELGGFVLRTGQVVDSPLPETGNPRIVDYSATHRSDFGDVYLAGKARFYLGGPSGLMQTSTIFGVPVAMASMVPLCPHCIGPRGLYIPVLLRDQASGEMLHYREAYERGLFVAAVRKMVVHSRDYADAGIDVIQSSPEDILDLCKDMLDQSNGTPPTDEARALQELYRERYTHQARNYRQAPSIAPSFALKYRHLIEE